MVTKPELKQMSIHPDTLKLIRKRRGLSQKGLADEIRNRGLDGGWYKLSSIKQIEKKQTLHAAHASTVKVFADALNVRPEILGLAPDEAETALSPEASQSHDYYVQLKDRVRAETRLALDLVASRYGLHPSAILEIAPLFALLMFESSLADRREKLGLIEDAMSAASAAAGSPDGHLAFAYAVSDLEEGVSREQKSIDERDIFGRQLVEDDFFNERFDPSVRNPFSDFLRAMTDKLREIGPDLEPDLMDIDEGFPRYDFVGAWVDKFTGTGFRARYALDHGYVRIWEVPAHLLGDDQTEERTKWLEQKVPESDWEESPMSKLPSFSLSVAEKGGA